MFLFIAISLPFCFSLSICLSPGNKCTISHVRPVNQKELWEVIWWWWRLFSLAAVISLFMKLFISLSAWVVPHLLSVKGCIPAQINQFLRSLVASAKLSNLTDLKHFFFPHRVNIQYLPLIRFLNGLKQLNSYFFIKFCEFLFSVTDVHNKFWHVDVLWESCTKSGKKSKIFILAR